MATIDSPEVLVAMLENGGVYTIDGESDPPIKAMIRYRNRGGTTSVAVAWNVKEIDRYIQQREAAFLYVDREVTEEGRAFVELVRSGQLRALPTDTI